MAVAHAEILMRAGRTDRALELLEQIATVPYGISLGELRALPWDALRSDPRFQKITEAARAASK